MHCQAKKLVYAGRFATTVSSSNYLSDRDTLPVALLPALEVTDLLIVLDMPSFPFDILEDQHWDVPMILFLPEEYKGEDIDTIFGDVVFRNLTFLDKVNCISDTVWDALRDHYHWAYSQRLYFHKTSLNENVAELLGEIRRSSQISPQLDDDYKFTTHWEQRATALDDLACDKFVCSLHHSLKLNKAMHRAQSASFGKYMCEIASPLEIKRKFSLLEMGCGIGRWCSLLNTAHHEYHGVDISSTMVEKAKQNYPEYQFSVINADGALPYPDEYFDIVFSVTVLHHVDTHQKKRILLEMFRVLRNGGFLVFLEDFVSMQRNKAGTVYRLGLHDFLELLMDQTYGQLVMDRMETVQYEHLEETRTGLLSFIKISGSDKC